MSLEEDTEEIEESSVEDEIKWIAADLDGQEPNSFEVLLVEIAIIDALSRHHNWTRDRVSEIYRISMTCDQGIWDVFVGPKDV